MEEENKIERMQDVLTNQEIALRLVETYGSVCEPACIDELISAYKIALKELNEPEEDE